jgi:hypothetical protein
MLVTVLNLQGHDDLLPLKPPVHVEPPLPLPPANKATDDSSVKNLQLMKSHRQLEEAKSKARIVAVNMQNTLVTPKCKFYSTSVTGTADSVFDGDQGDCHEERRGNTHHGTRA